MNLRSGKQEIVSTKLENACQKCSSALSPSLFHDASYSEKYLSTENNEPTEQEKEENSRNRTLLRTWSSFPDLNKNYENLEERSTSTETLAFKYKPEKKLLAQLNCDVELASVIKVNYSETKDLVSSSERKTSKLKGLSRKGRSKAKVSRNLHAPKKYNSGSSDTLNYEDSVQAVVNEPFVFSRQSSVESSITDSVEIVTPKRKTSFIACSAPEFTSPWSLEVEGQKDIRRTPKKSFMEDGGSSVQPMATGYFPRPLEGQSITSFLSSAQFSRANAELDRENAHFSISEAMISAIEQVKCNRQLNLFEETVEESDEEINNLKQRIRFRRRQRQEEKRKGVWIRDLLSDGKTDSKSFSNSEYIFFFY